MWKFGGLEIKSLGRKCELGGGQKRRGRRVEFVEKMIYLYSHYSCVSSMMLICVCSAWVLGDLFVCDHRFLIILYVMAMLRCSDFGVSLRRALKNPVFQNLSKADLAMVCWIPALKLSEIVNKSTSSRDHAFGYSSFEGWLIISHASGLAGEQNHDLVRTFQIDD